MLKKKNAITALYVFLTIVLMMVGTFFWSCNIASSSSLIGRGLMTSNLLCNSAVSERTSEHYEDYRLIPASNGRTEERILKAMDRGNARGLTREEMSLLNIVSKFTNTVSSYSDYEKVRYAVKFICMNCSYDLEAPEKYSAYACLVNRRAVCSGYSRAMQLLLAASGIECYYVTGSANNADYINHAWNIFRIDGVYYQCDVTWADNDDGTIDWTYIGMSDKQTSESRIWDRKLYPICCSSLRMSA